MSEVNDDTRLLSNACVPLECSSSSKDYPDSNNNSNPPQPPPMTAGDRSASVAEQQQQHSNPNAAANFAYPSQRKRSLQAFTGSAGEGTPSKVEDSKALVRRATAHLLSSMSSTRPSRNASLDCSSFSAALPGQRPNEPGGNSMSEGSRLSIASDGGSGGAGAHCSPSQGERTVDAATGNTSSMSNTNSTSTSNNNNNNNSNSATVASQRLARRAEALQHFTPLTNSGFDRADQSPAPWKAADTLRTLFSCAHLATGKEQQAVLLRRSTATRLAQAYLHKFVEWSALPRSKVRPRPARLVGAKESGIPSTRGELGSLSWTQEANSPLSLSTPAASSPLQSGSGGSGKRGKDLPQWTLVDCTKYGSPNGTGASQQLQRSRSLQSGDSGGLGAAHPGRGGLHSRTGSSPAGWLMSSTRSNSTSTFDMGYANCIDLDSVVQVEAENRTRRVEKEERQRHRLEARATAALDELFRAALQQRLKAGLHPSLLSSSCQSDLVGPEDSGSDGENIDRIHQQLLERSQQLRGGSFAGRSADHHSSSLSFGASSGQPSPARSRQEGQSNPLSPHSSPSQSPADMLRGHGLVIPSCFSLDNPDEPSVADRAALEQEQEATPRPAGADPWESAASLSEGAPDSFSCTRRPAEEEEELSLARRTYSSLVRHSEAPSGSASPGETPQLARLTSSSHHLDMGSGPRVSPGGSNIMNNFSSTQKPSTSPAAAATVSAAMEGGSLPHAVFLLELRRPEREGRQAIAAEWQAGLQAMETQLKAGTS